MLQHNKSAWVVKEMSITILPSIIDINHYAVICFLNGTKVVTILMLENIQRNVFSTITERMHMYF